jgi:hypothetical protein
MGTLATVADRLNLWAMLSESGPVTSDAFAERAQINERYAREWLAAHACHGYLAYDNTTKQFTLPPEHAFVLADTDSPFYLGSMLAICLQVRRRRAAGTLRHRFLVRLRALHPHRLPQ